LHKHPYYIAAFNYESRAFKVSESVYERIISLPIYPGLSNEEVEQVICSVDEVLKEFRA